jgi:hypothetical protein
MLAKSALFIDYNLSIENLVMLVTLQCLFKLRGLRILRLVGLLRVGPIFAEDFLLLGQVDDDIRNGAILGNHFLVMALDLSSVSRVDLLSQVNKDLSYLFSLKVLKEVMVLLKIKKIALIFLEGPLMSLCVLAFAPFGLMFRHLLYNKIQFYDSKNTNSRVSLYDKI